MEIDSWLKRYAHLGVHLGLERMQRLLADLGHPHQRVPVIHVAGSNGKGSVCAYLYAVLTQAGYRVGRYTSPHLIDWTERICLNEQPITSAALERALLQVEAALGPETAAVTQFEVFTAAAWWIFAQEQVEIAVVEVGLGGRLDATNVCDRPLVSVITSLSREHWQILGPTLADIAREKAAILKPGCPAVIGPLPEAARAVVEERIAALSCPALWPAPARSLGIPASSRWEWAESQGIAYPLALAGEIQLTNSALAIAVLQLLRQQGWRIEERAIVAGMACTHWPGRLQWFPWRGQLLLLDGAHNPAAAQVLRQFVDQQQPASVTWIMGMLATKDHQDILQALLRPGDALHLVPVPDQATAAPEELAVLAQATCPGLVHCRRFPDVVEALEAAIAAHADTVNLQVDPVKPLMVLCGSLYLLGYFLKSQAVSSGVK